MRRVIYFNENLINEKSWLFSNYRFKSNRSVVYRKISRHIVKMSAPTMAEDKINGKVAEDDGGELQAVTQNGSKVPVDRLPLITTLLRASRDGNEVIIKSALRDVIVNGISKEELNLTDKSGRVSQTILINQLLGNIFSWVRVSQKKFPESLESEHRLNCELTRRGTTSGFYSLFVKRYSRSLGVP